MKMLLTLSLLLRCSFKGVAGNDIMKITNVNEFKNFVNNVNSGTTYSDTTVFLDSDLSLSGKTLEPISYFLGTFDGQGHIISNLEMSTTSQYTGLFGYSNGLTIRNVVLDDSCAITSSYSGSYDVYVGGIVGECCTNIGRCIVENNVNMADVTFSGSTDRGNLYLGGIAGYFSSSPISVDIYDIYAKNCVNYGSITDLGTVSNSYYYAYLGGITGYDYEDSISTGIQNCLNYGTITHNGTSIYLVIGGVVGYGYHTHVTNCVSAGRIFTPTTASEDNYIGSVMGYVGSSSIHINYCYYTSDVNVSSLHGQAGSLPSTTGTPDTPTDVDSELASNLNKYATEQDGTWSKWLLNANNATVTFKMSDNKELSISSQIILIPDPTKEGNSFLFWCKDAECAEEFEAESVSGNTDLYAGWMNSSVTFDFDNGTTGNATFSYNTEIIYPNNLPEKEGYTLSWDNYHELMPARGITVTAQWIPNDYTVIFDANGGNVSETSKIVTFTEKYGDLPEPNRTEYVFIGWFTNETGGTEVTNETVVNTLSNHVLYAHWEKVTTQVVIVFSTKDLTKKEVKELVEQYTKADFTIAGFENESEEIRVIIKFNDNEDAAEFVRNIKESSRATDLIKRISFDQDIHDLAPTMIYPLLFFNTLFL